MTRTKNSIAFRRRTAARLESLEGRLLLTATPWTQYAGNAQHAAQSPVGGQSLDVIHWETPVDLHPQYSGSSLLIHYGSPIATANNTIIVPERNETNGGYDIRAFDGATGALKWTQTEGEEHISPSSSWVPSYAPARRSPGGPRLYFAGASGTVFYRDAPDSSGAVSAGRIAFYGSSNLSAYSDVKVSSPLTTDSQGILYFTYEVEGGNSGGLTGGIVRIAANGTATYADVGTPALNAAPALSNDQTKLYVVINGYLAEYDSTSLTFINRVLPADGSVLNLSSASPTVGPNGDVFFGVWNSANDFRGYLEHYSANLSTTYAPGPFGWDDTVSIVPASMVPVYTGASSYLLMSKDNEYGNAGSGINRIAIFDPNPAVTTTDAFSARQVMTTVMSIAGVTPDPGFPNKPGAVREWCINSAFVDPATKSVFANSEDGYLYRWDLTANTFTQRIQLTSGVGEAYTPTIIGPDGTVFAINNAVLFAVGQTPTISINNVSIVEGNAGTTNAVFTVSLSSSSTQQVTVAFSTANNSATAGSDYQTTSGVLTFSPATTASGGVTTQTIIVPIIGDTNFESDETFFVNLTSPTNATIAQGQATGTIVNDEPAIVVRLTIGVGTGTPNYTTNWFNSGAVSLENTAQATVSSPGGLANLSSMTIALSSPHAGDVLSVPILPIGGLNITATGGTGGTPLTLSGSDTVFHYQQQLRYISYNNTSGGPGVSSQLATVTASDGTLTSAPVTATINVSVASGEILGNRLFYNQSLGFDGNSAAINANDDNAIAPDKVGFNGSGTASFANISSYNRGINGVMVDLQSGLGTHNLINLTSLDITYKVAPAFSGSYNDITTWTAAPTPTAISVRMGAGTNGSDRLEITWAANAIKNNWLEVNVKVTGNTGLSQPDIFYFGNTAGDSGIGNSTGITLTDATDTTQVNNNLSQAATLYITTDYTRDGLVDATDATQSNNNVAKSLNYIANPTGGFAPESGGGGGASATSLAAPASAPASSTANAVTSGLSFLNTISTPNLSNHLTTTFQTVLSSPPVSTILQAVTHNPQVLHAIDHVAEKLHAQDDLLDELLAELGLE